MHPELKALLDAARRDPEDDSARLVLADWLEEHGDEAERARAQFIRLQVQTNRLPYRDPQRRQLEEQAWQLDERYQSTWLGCLRQLAGKDALSFFAGMVALRRTEAAWLDRFVCDRCSARTAETVLAADWLEHFSHLCLNYTPLSAHHIDLLAKRTHLAEVVLIQNGLGPEGLHRLTRCSDEARLTRLGYLNNQARDQGVGGLAESSLLGRLVSLTLLGNEIGPDGVRILANALRVPSLRHLDLSHNALTDEGVLHLAHCRALVGLRWLDLAGNQIGLLGATALAESPYLGRLRHLLLGMNNLDEAARQRLLERFGADVLFY
jgi:uncharacterized protein (TIGR02996 family)